MRTRHPGPTAVAITGVDTLEGRPVGSVVRIVGIDGGAQRTMRLLSLGLRTGSVVTVTHVRGRGVVVAADTGRVAIGPEMARHIRVEPVERSAVR